MLIMSAPFKSIRCPKEEDHAKPKLLLFSDSEGLYVNCHAHAWIRVEIYKNGQRLDFSDISVICRSMGPEFHFNHDPIPVVASGKFKCKPSFKRNAVTDKKP